jgi:hypothetical protein
MQQGQTALQKTTVATDTPTTATKQTQLQAKQGTGLRGFAISNGFTEHWQVLINKGLFEEGKAILVKNTLPDMLQTTKSLTAFDALNEDSATVATMCKYVPQGAFKGLIFTMLEELLSVYSVGRGMSNDAIVGFFECLTREYYFLKISELKTFFYMAKMGKFGPVYDRLDLPTLSIWLSKYDELRTDARELMKDKQQVVYDAKSYEPSKVIADWIASLQKPKPKPIPTQEEFAAMETTIVNYNYLVTNGFYSDTYENYVAEKWTKIYRNEK